MGYVCRKKDRARVKLMRFFLLLHAITLLFFATAFLWSLHLFEILMYCQFDFVTFKPSTKSDD